jgi:hypothetical protein
MCLVDQGDGEIVISELHPNNDLRIDYNYDDLTTNSDGTGATASRDSLGSYTTNNCNQDIK